MTTSSDYTEFNDRAHRKMQAATMEAGLLRDENENLRQQIHLIVEELSLIPLYRRITYQRTALRNLNRRVKEMWNQIESQQKKISELTEQNYQLRTGNPPHKKVGW